MMYIQINSGTLFFFTNVQQNWVINVYNWMTIFLEKICRCKRHSVRWAGAGAGGWSGVREKYCWLAGGWKLVLERCERKTLLGWRLLELPNRVIVVTSCANLLSSHQKSRN